MIPNAQRFAVTDIEVRNRLDLGGIRVPHDDCYWVMILHGAQERVPIFGQHVEVYLASHTLSADETV